MTCCGYVHVMSAQEKDFYEGVRCMLVDKGSKPVWSPKTLEEVTPETVESYFSPRFK